MEAAYLEELRAQTAWFIAQDPTDLVLYPRTATTGPGGGKTYGKGTARAAQRVKLISQGGKGIIAGEGGTDRQYDYVIMGLHTATILVGDTFKIGNNEFVVESMVPADGYQVKAYARQHGMYPTDG